MKKVKRIIQKILILFVIVNLITPSFYPVLLYAQDSESSQVLTDDFGTAAPEDPLLAQTPGRADENDINKDFEAVRLVVVDEETQDKTLEDYDELAQKMVENTSQAANVSARASFEEGLLQDPGYIPPKAVETLVEAPAQAANTGGNLLADALQTAGNFVGGVLGAVGQVFQPQTEEQVKEALQKAEGTRAEPTIPVGNTPEYCNALDFSGTPQDFPECYPEQRFEGIKEEAAQAGIKVEGDPTNFAVSLTGAPDLRPYIMLGEAPLTLTEEENEAARKSAEALAKFAISLLPGGAFPELVEKSNELTAETFVVEAVCKQAGFIDSSYVRKLLAQTPKSGQKQRQEVLELGQQVNPQFRQQTEEVMALTYEGLLAMAKVQDPSLEGRLTEISSLSQEEAKAKCGRETTVLETKIEDLNTEIAANTALEIAGALPVAEVGVIAVKKSAQIAKPFVRKITDPIGDVAKGAWDATLGRIFGGAGKEIVQESAEKVGLQEAPTLISTAPAPEKTFRKYAAGSTKPERFGITYRSGGEEEFDRLKQMYEVAPDNVPRPKRVLWDSEAFEPEMIEMEFVRGVTAGEYINTNGSLPEEIKQQIRDVVEKFHKNGLAHGDLNPTNIIITPDGKVKFIDPVAYENFTPEMAALDLQTLEKWIDSGFIKGGRKTNPTTRASAVSEAVDRSTQEIAQEAGRIANEFFPEGAELWKDTIQYWLMEGKGREEIKDALRRSKKLVDYMESRTVVIYPVPGRTDLQPRQVLRPPGPDAPKEVLEAWNALNYSGVGTEGLRGDASYRLVNTAEAIFEQHRSVSGIGYVLDDTKNLLNRLKNFCIEHTSGDSWCNAVNPGAVVDPSAIHLVSAREMSIFAGTDSFGGLYSPRDKQILMNKDVFGGHSVLICLHEGVHKSCGLTNPEASKILTQSLLRQKFSRLPVFEEFMARQNMRKLDEGLTEFATQWAHRLSGIEPTNKAYLQAVSAVENDIVGELMKNSGRSREEAIAIVVEAALTGRHEKLFKEVGGGDLKRGVDLVNDILDKIPSVDPRILPPSASIVVGNTTTAARLYIAATAAGLAAAAIGIAGVGSENSQPVEENPESQPLLPQLLPWRIINEAFAQGSTEQYGPKVDAQEFEFLVKKYLIKNALIEYGEVDSEFVDQVMKMDIFPSKAKATVDGYILTAGSAGYSESSVEPNKYIVNVNAISGVNIKIPGVVDVKTGQLVIVPIAVREGSGKVEKKGYTQGGEVDKDLPAEALAKTGEETGKVTIVVFADKNNNGKLDKNEDILPWAGLTVELRRVSNERVISLSKGENQVTLPILPDRLLTASILLREIALQEGDAISVSTLENGAWKTYVAEGAKAYSFDDFPILPEKTYVVKANKDSTLVLKGQEFAVAPKGE